MEDDFNDFIDGLLIAAAAKQSGERVEWVNLLALCKEVHPNFPPTWEAMAVQHLRARELGRITQDSSGRTIFKLKAAGLALAAEARRDRFEQSPGRRVKVWLAKEAVALGALAVAIIALFAD